MSRFKFYSAVHLLLIKNDHILLLRRYNTGYEDGNYSVIAGHLDGGETIPAAMIREAWEEAGITLSPADLRVVGVMHRLADQERIDFFLTADSWQGEITNREPHKCDHLGWFPPANLPPNVIPYVKRGLQNYQTGVWFDSFGF